MKKVLYLFFFIFCLNCIFVANAQTPGENGINAAHAKVTREYGDSTSRLLVSTYTFNRLAYREFAKITVGDDAFSKVQRYASLSIKPEESKFYFSPLIITNYKDPSSDRLKHIFSIDASGSIGSDNVFRFSDYKTLKVGLSYTYIFNRWNFLAITQEEAVYRQQLADCIKKKVTASIKDNCNEYLYDGDSSKLASAGNDEFYSELSDAEEKWADDGGWGAKKIAWLKINLNPASWDHFKYYDSLSPASIINLSDTTLFSPSGSIAISGYRISSDTRFRLYGTISVGATYRNQLSEVGQAQSWNKYNKINDSIYIAKDNQSIYALSEKIKQKMKPDIGAQVIAMFDFKKNIRVGLDLSMQYKGLVGNDNNASLLTTNLGIVFPFLDKDGNTSINVEVFYEADSYNKMALDNKNFWGARFSLPINFL